MLAFGQKWTAPPTPQSGPNLNPPTADTLRIIRDKKGGYGKGRLDLASYFICKELPALHAYLRQAQIGAWRAIMLYIYHIPPARGPSMLSNLARGRTSTARELHHATAPPSTPRHIHRSRLSIRYLFVVHCFPCASRANLRDSSRIARIYLLLFGI